MKDNQTKYPQLRFKGFTDPWEQRKLGKMGYTFTGLSGKTKEDFGHGNAKFVTYMNVFSSPVSNSEMVENVEVDSKQHQVEYGDVFFTTSSETPQEVGMSSVWLETAENIYLNSFCFGYHPMVEFDPYYLAFMLRSPVIRKKFMLLAQGISRYNISKNKVMEMLVPVPEIVEQQKIGSFFKQLDDTITLHQRKLAKLKELKQGYLQKLFPKNGSKFPQLRFAGFADAWEQRKLTEIVNRVNKSSNSDVLPKVEFEDIVSGEGRLNKDISSKLDSRKGTLFESENILYGKLRPYLKNWLFPDFEGVALGDFWVFEATDVSVPSFDYYLIQSDDYQKVANDTSGTKMPRSDWKNVSSTDFAIPSKDEQKQIGAFFKQLDDTITLHQRKLEKLQELKKGYLQKMFC
ncbi:restriction endonuclease subunit S [Pediococcus pentosaceus]|uniref:restriction endonuclease subunit S n=1 Tax=Pediococcus pentosaceus TaxID=1255 RepID=UPI0018FE863E|nr:restriction endonuclease subunit S [Pediococcus pentosaceus]MBF7105244.1 restriction endonuclease subunit S [Pediococcus pentosaceus]